MKKRIAILISGRGSNMQAIVQACQRCELNAEVVAVISNRPDALGLQFAQQNGIATQVIDHTTFDNREAFDHQLGLSLEALTADWIALAGFMRVLGSSLVQRFEGRMINIHPSLLPSHPGLNTHARALEAGDKQHGASVHFVTPVLDAGPVIAQTAVEVLTDDTPETLSKRVLSIEHTLYVNALQLCVNQQVIYVDGELKTTDAGHDSTIASAKNGNTI